MSKTEVDLAVTELNRAVGLNLYEGFDIAWIAVIKIANLLPGSTEHGRLIEVMSRLPDDTVRSILHHEAINTLFDLEPPLETILTSPHERLNPQRTAQELETIRRCRESDPKLALRNLAELLKRIRNRRAHGFKTPDGPRDTEILSAALTLLRLIGLSAAELLGRGRKKSITI